MIDKTVYYNPTSFKAPSDFEASCIILTNTKSVKPIIGIIGNAVAEIFTGFFYPSKNIYFKAKKDDCFDELLSIIFEKYFEGFLMAKAVNRSRAEYLGTEDETDAVLEMHQKSFFVPYLYRKKVDLDSERVSKKAIFDGICFGITCDIAKRYLIEEEKIPKIVIENQKGTLPLASANQAIYNSILPKNYTYQEIMMKTMKTMESAKQSHPEDPFFNASFIRVLEALTVVDEAVAMDEKRFPLFNPSFPLRKEDPLVEFMTVEKLKAEKAFRLGSDHPWLKLNNKGMWVISSPSEFKKAAAFYMDKTTLDWLEGILEYRMGMDRQVDSPMPKRSRLGHRVLDYFGKIEEQKKPYSYISNPRIREVFEQIAIQNHFWDKEEVMFRCHDLKQKSVENLIGNHVMHESDEGFLAQIPNLPSGFYTLSFVVGDSSHVVSYIKTDDGIEYILDPNGMQLISTSPDESIYLFKKLLALYETRKSLKKHNIQIVNIVPV